MQTLKKTMFIVITAVLLLALIGIPTVFAEGETGTGMDGDFDWEETAEDAVTITAYTGPGGSVTIPATLSGKTVTAISDTAFKYDEDRLIKHVEKVTEIIIQAPITTIAEGTFTECTSLESVIFEVSTITEIEANAFSGTALTSIKIPASVETIGANAFNACSELATVTFDTGNTVSMLTTIGEGAFSGTKLTSVRIPTNVETIGDNAFSDCDALEVLIFASKYNLATIGNSAFKGTKLVNVTIPESIQSIGAQAFADCEALTKVIINSTEVDIGTGAFEFSALLVIYAPSGSPADVFCRENTPYRINFIPLETTVGDTAITSVVSSGASRITISWSEAERATGYEVWRKGVTGDFIKIATVNERTYTNTGLSVSATYYYKVRAINKPDDSHTYYGNYSEVVTATPLPGAPNSVYAVSAGYNSINISWTPVSGASGYEIWRANDKIDNPYSLVKTLVKSTSGIAAIAPNTYKFTSLTSGRKYYYKVRAYVNAVNPATNTTMKSFGAFSGISMARPVPAAVTNLKATVYSPTSIKLTWNSVSGRSRYEIWRKGPDDEQFVLYPYTTSYNYFTNDRGIVVDKEYSYKVRAYRTSSAYGDNGKIYGGFSNEVTITPYVKQVTGLTVKRYNNTRLNISWSGLTGVDGYELQWALSADAPDEEWTTVDRRTYRYYYHTGRTDGTTYYYRVRAYEKVIRSEEYPEGKSYGDWSVIKYGTP